MLNNLNRLEDGLGFAQRPLGSREFDPGAFLAAPSPAPKPYVRPDGTRVPHTFVDHKGAMLYLPPEPSAQVKAPTAPVQAKKAEAGAISPPTTLGKAALVAADTPHPEWFQGLPPVAGFYECSNAKVPLVDRVRWFDGEHFTAGFAGAYDLHPKAPLRLRASEKSLNIAPSRWKWRPISANTRRALCENPEWKGVLT